jgi:hypothetical protein
MFSSMVAWVSLTSVPKENCATRRATELADVDWSFSSRGTPLIARSIGSATWLATSVAEAPGNGATTVMTGKSMSGSSSCWSLPHAEMPAMNSAAARSSVTLRFATASWERRLIGDPFGGRRWMRRARGRRPR